MLYKSFHLAGVLFILSFTVHAEENWARWRGPTGQGHYANALPVKWSAEDLAWKTTLPGSGQSTPVLWGEKIFLTSASEDGKERYVFCLDSASGKILWRQTAWSGVPEETHKMNSFASATCAVDEARVVAFFGKGGIHCYDHAGKLLWRHDLGVFAGPWGTAASPVIVGDLVIQNCDADNEAFLVAFDKQSGKEKWRTPRDRYRGWSTPILVEKPRTELILNGHTGMKAYNPATGEELWFCQGDSGRGSPTVVMHENTVIAVNGRPGDMVAVEAGGSGTVTGKREQWRVGRRSGRDLPSPVLSGDYLLVINMPGVATVYDPASGKELSRARLGGNFSASPITAGGLVYVPSEEGEILVLKPGEELEIVARNKVPAGDGEIFRASLTPANGRILCRSDRVLYCIDAK